MNGTLSSFSNLLSHQSQSVGQPWWVRDVIISLIPLESHMFLNSLTINSTRGEQVSLYFSEHKKLKLFSVLFSLKKNYDTISLFLGRTVL